PKFQGGGVDRGIDESSPVIAFDHNLCIVCDRCVRACDEVKENGVIGRMNKGYGSRIAFDLNDPMADSSCVACGECMISCPTGALTNKLVHDVELPVGTSLDADELLALPMFRGVSGTFLELNRGAVVRRTYAPGEIICREGEYGST